MSKTYEELKSRYEKIKQQEATLIAKREVYEERLKELGFGSVTAAKARLDAIDKEIAETEKRIEEKTAEIKAALNE